MFLPILPNGSMGGLIYLKQNAIIELYPTKYEVCRSGLINPNSETKRSKIKMKESTKIEYRAKAQGFYKKHFPDGDITAGKLVIKMKEIAPDYRPDSWRNLRNAIRFDQEEKGFKKAADLLGIVKNPTTTPEAKKNGVKPKAKQHRCKTVSNETAISLMTHLAQHDGKDYRMWAAVLIAQVTGCRPAEMTDIKQLSDNEFFITGAKKSEDGDRGLDRTVRVINEQDAKRLSKAIKFLAGEPHMKQVQDNIATATKAILPMHSQRHKRPSLYSFRHQHGSNLKASGMSRIETAYLMGHQSTNSINVYGSRRSGGGLSVEAGVSLNEVQSVVRDNYDNAPENSQEQGRALDTGLSI